MSRIPWVDLDSIAFPSVECALREPDGLLAVGGDLSPARLIAAYRQGIFPWYSLGQPILWWSPDPRAVLFLEKLHVSRSLSKTIGKGIFTISVDSAFAQVVADCAAPRDATGGTWITPAMHDAYCELHAQGVAHSVECWSGGELAGGIYGVALGRIFFGESMFSRFPNASKVAFTHLAWRLREWGYTLIDCQMPSGHLFRFGAELIPRRQFIELLREGENLPEPTQPWF